MPYKGKVCLPSETNYDELLKYLDNLEENNPIIKGYNSLQKRRLSAINFEQRLAGNRQPAIDQLKRE
jgi:hypothetical protein